MKYLVLIVVFVSFDVVCQIDVEELQRKHNEVMDTVVAVKTEFNSIGKFPDAPDRDDGRGVLICSKDAFIVERESSIESWTQNHRFQYNKEGDTLEVYDNNFGVGDYYWDSFHIKNLADVDTIIWRDEYYKCIFLEVKDDFINGTRVYWMNTKTYKIDAFEIYTGYYGIGEVLILSNLTLNPAIEPYFSEFPDKIILSTYPNAVIKDSTYDNPYTRP